VHRLVLSQLRRRPARTLALLLGILVATASFGVLTGASRSQQLQVQGTVSRHARVAFDVLVRPSGARTALERRQGLVRPGLLSGIAGGITLAQWRQILNVPGVAVAAPIATIGYVLPDNHVPVDLSALLPRRGRALFRVRVTRLTDRGLTSYRDADVYAYVTPNPLMAPTQTGPSLSFAPGELDHGHTRPVCVTNWQTTIPSGPFDPRTHGALYGLDCWSRRDGLRGQGYATVGKTRRIAALVPDSVPFVLAAIDPVQEAKLEGLNRAVLSGRYLRPADRPSRTFIPQVPVLAPSHSYTDDTVDAVVEQLPPSAADTLYAYGANLRGARLARFLAAQSGRVVRHVRIGSQIATQALERALRGPASVLPAVTDYWTVGPARYRADSSGLVPQGVANPKSSWVSQAHLGYFPAPLSANDVQFRSLAVHQGSINAEIQSVFPVLRAVGSFDPARLYRFADPVAGALQTFQNPALVGANARSRRLLGNRPLLPNSNLGGYETQPPLLLTTLRSLSAFTGSNFTPDNGVAPISAIRVRVAGAHGIDPVSRERVRLVAQRIEQRTHLDVDLTIGSSTAPQTVALPAGRHGRPALALTEPWTRKGVALSILQAVDRKSLILFALILVVCALFVANATTAATRARRTELGLLAGMGWTSARLFLALLSEVGAIGLAGGLGGATVALLVAHPLHVGASLTRAAIAVAAAVLLALLAGIPPALSAARADPAAAARPAIRVERRVRRPRTVLQLALVNLLRVPGRTALGALSLAVGVAAVSFLLAATIAFHDVLVGTLLGHAVAVQVHTSDIAAAAAAVALGVAAVIDVQVLNMRERAGEVATLRAIGWRTQHLRRMVATEGACTGIAGSLLGALVGSGAAAVFAGNLPPQLVLTTALASVAGATVAVLAALAPAILVARMPLTPLLASE